ncbi:MAG: 2-oxo acid dehydrogenase subunit E2 [Brevefilum sp.]|nr:2-oxo acid dehydrogenase subunit E2 [Brevefilum sp.]
MPTKVIMPKLGESIVEGTVTGWLKQEGDKIAEYESLLDVETDKVTTEVPSPASGTLLKILVPEGETVAVDTILAWIGEPGEEIPDKGETVTHDHEPHETPDSESITDEPVIQTPAGRDEDLGYISPVVARLAREKKVDLHKVKGTGMDGRITKKDLQAYIKERTGEEEVEVPIWETPADGDLFRPTELVFAKQAEQPPRVSQAEPSVLPSETLSLSPMRKRIAEHMQHSKRTAPHVTTVMEADLSQVARHRETAKLEAGSGVHLTYTAYFLAAIVTGLKAVPLANSSWTDAGIRVHKQINLSMAVALPSGGLIVPVIKNADELSLIGLAKKINDLAERARKGKLEPDEVQNGTFTLTNHGTKGSLFATPIINQPQSGILGAGLIQKRPVVVNDAIAIKPMVYLSYSFDHRILDGASADTFLAHVVHALENWQ